MCRVVRHRPLAHSERRVTRARFPKVLLARAMNGHVMNRWEYQIVSVADIRWGDTSSEATAADELNREGLLGWEATSIHTSPDGTIRVIMRRREDAH